MSRYFPAFSRSRKELSWLSSIDISMYTFVISCILLWVLFAGCLYAVEVEDKDIGSEKIELARSVQRSAAEKSGEMLQIQNDDNHSNNNKRLNNELSSSSTKQFAAYTSASANNGGVHRSQNSNNAGNNAPNNVVNNGLNKESIDDRKKIAQLMDIIEKIREEYPIKLKNEEIIENALRGIINNLDPYSSYLSPEEYARFESHKDDSIIGIGVNCFPTNNGMMKCMPYPNGPAYLAGMRAGDIIIAINGRSVMNLSDDEILHRLKGGVGSIVSLEVKSQGNKIKILNIKRDRFVPKKIISTLFLNGKIGYIQINRDIEASSYAKVKSTFIELEEVARRKEGTNIQGLIIDLRDNQGGSLESAISIADMFLQKAQKILTYELKRGTIRKAIYSNGNDISKGIPIVVMINSGTASASEVIAAALQENHRALLVGTKTYGKACVQKMISLDGYGMARIVSGVFYTPNGKMIQSTGIQPDIFVPEAAVIRVAQSDASSMNHANENDRVRMIVNHSSSQKYTQDDSLKDDRNIGHANSAQQNQKIEDRKEAERQIAQTNNNIKHSLDNADNLSHKELEGKKLNNGNEDKIDNGNQGANGNQNIAENQISQISRATDGVDKSVNAGAAISSARMEKIGMSEYRVLVSEYANDFQLTRAIDILTSMIFYRDKR